jgi:maltokinase
MDLAEVERFVRERPGELLPPRLRAASPGELLDVVPLPPAGGLAIVGSSDGLLVVPVAGGGATRRAVAGDGVWRALLDLIADDGARGALRARRGGDVPASGPERAIDVDQSNDSVSVGGAVVKLFVRTSPGPQPAADLPAHLAAVGFRDTPGSVGAVTWGTGDDAALVATAATFLPVARDGWEWYSALVEAALDEPGARGPAVDAAARIGAVVGGMHRALATPSAIIPAPVGRAEASAWLPAAVAALAEAVAATDGEEGDRLRAMAPDAAAVIATLATMGATPVMRIHGDLHVGQMLRWDGGMAVSDFDGNPLAPLEERLAPGPPVRDVAAMARAIDHVGRIVQHRHPGREDDIAAWIADARAAFLDVYRDAAPEGLFDERLLGPLEVWQEAHEYAYAARYLPRWRYVPDLAMPALLAAIG